MSVQKIQNSKEKLKKVKKEKIFVYAHLHTPAKTFTWNSVYASLADITPMAARQIQLNQVILKIVVAMKRQTPTAHL